MSACGIGVLSFYTMAATDWQRFLGGWEVLKIRSIIA